MQQHELGAATPAQPEQQLVRLPLNAPSAQEKTNWPLGLMFHAGPYNAKTNRIAQQCSVIGVVYAVLSTRHS